MNSEKIIIHGGIRTHDLWIRSPARYPLRYADAIETRRTRHGAFNHLNGCIDKL